LGIVVIVTVFGGFLISAITLRLRAIPAISFGDPTFACFAACP
jgi:hypothetical protein